MSALKRKSFCSLCTVIVLLFVGSAFGATPLLPEGLIMEDKFRRGFGAPVGQVQVVQGKVIIIHGKVVRGYWAKKGLPLYKGDTIVTQEKARISFKLIDKSIMTLSSNTKLVINESIYKPKKKRRSSFLGLTLGKARFFVTKLLNFKRSEFRVKTRTAICGVRGSDFIVVATEKLTEVTALADTELEVVSLAAPEVPPVIIKDFERTGVELGKLPFKPEIVPPAEIENLKKDLTVTPEGAPPEEAEAVKEEEEEGEEAEEEEGEAEEGKEEEGEAEEGEPSEEEAEEGEPAEEEAEEGEPAEEEAEEGEPAEEGELAEEEAEEREAGKGEIVEEEVSEGEVVEGEAVEEEAPVGEAPVGEVAEEEVPVEEVPVGEVAEEEVPVGEVPVGEIAEEEVPVGEVPMGEIVEEEAPVSEVPMGEIIEEEIPVGEVPAVEVPVSDFGELAETVVLVPEEELVAPEDIIEIEEILEPEIMPDIVQEVEVIEQIEEVTEVQEQVSEEQLQEDLPMPSFPSTP